MRTFASPFKNLKLLPLLSGLSVLIAVSCATRPAPQPLSADCKQFLVRWEKEAPLCSVSEVRFANLVKEKSSRNSKQIVSVLQGIDWGKERALRLEAAKHFSTLPANVSDEDYALLSKFTCKLSVSQAAVSALVKLETSNARKVPAKSAMKAIERYVDSGPSTGIVQLLLQWSILRELSISPYYFSKISAPIVVEMDAFAARLKAEREEASRRPEARDTYEAYANFRADAGQAIELQKSYDAIMFKLRGVLFR